MFPLRSLCFFSRHHYHPSNRTKPLIFLFSSLSTPTHPPKSDTLDYLINTFKLSETKALSIINTRKGVICTKNAQFVFNYFQDLGLSDAQIQSVARVMPQILFANVEKSIQPKIEYFQELGFVGSDLGKFISKNASVLTFSLHRKLIPSVEILKKFLSNDENNRDILFVLMRWGTILGDPKSALVANIQFLQNCGIVGSQLSMLLKRQTWLFARRKSIVRDLVSRALDMGFSLNSRMLAHGLHALSSVSNNTVRRKLKLFRSYGFSEDECMIMFRKAPTVMRTSVEKLKFGIDFFMNTVNMRKSIIISRPCCLMFSMEERVIPRYRILQILKSKKLLKKDPSFVEALFLTEGKFLEKYILRFTDNVEELLVAYKGKFLDSFGQKS